LTQVLAELNADGTEKTYYTRGTDLISQERDGKTSYYLYDGHGSVRMLADESGNVTDTYDYDAFGNLTNSTGNTANNYRYCGEQFDGTTGLYYLRARYMNPNTGTFISMDSYSGSINDPVSLHKYLYANANPVMYSDPSGYSSLLTEIVVEVVVQNVLTGIISGSVSMGLSILNDMACATPDKPFEFGSNQVSAFVEGFLLGALLGNVCVLAKSLQMIFIIRALAVISALNGMMCAVEGYKANQSGHYELGLAYGTLAILSFAGAGKGWQEANNLSNAVNTASTNNLTSGKGRAPKISAPNSVYEQVDNQDPNVIISRTTYNQNGDTWIRDDYYVGSHPRTHYNKTTNETYYDHRHIYGYNDDGYVNYEEVIPILPPQN
jgi:RHS repeat-associated protein